MNNSQDALLVDTSVMIDVFKSGHRREFIDSLRAQFDWSFSTDIALLEFKAVLLQQMITIHAKMRELGSFTRVRDEMIESMHLQSKLRAHIFNNFINVHATSHDITPEKDQDLADRARIILQAHIPRLYDAFNEELDSIQTNGIGCTRAAERPKLKAKSFGTNIPVCQRGFNKDCKIESFIRSAIVPRLSEIRAVADSIRTEKGDASAAQLDRACRLIESVRDDLTADLSANQCRNAGDCLITFAGENVATHCTSTNRREWEPLSALIDAEFVPVNYPRLDRTKK